MNVLILTPDSVGSTLLQRTLTIYMLRKGFDKPLVNCGELTNGIIKYYNPDLEMEMLKHNSEGKYYQTLDEIVDLLSSVDHYKTNRLAHYHIVRRNDSIKDQLKLYDYLNQNYYIISCRRKNIFEYALSWIIKSHSKTLNVYNRDEKTSNFNDIYKNGIIANRETFEYKLKVYKEYIEWADSQFDVQNCFYYEDSINSLEDYILKLDFMNGHKDNTWEDMFGMSFDIWNKVHKTVADIELIKDTKDTIKVKIPKILDSDWEKMKGIDWPKSLPLDLNTINDLDNKDVVNEITTKIETIDTEIKIDKFNFLKENIKQYRSVIDIQEDLVTKGFLVSPLPIKLQTFQEKKKVIKNYNECIEWYNEWVTKNNFGEIYKEENFEEYSTLEEQKHNSFDNLLSHKE